jgi:hypothetical protein
MVDIGEAQADKVREIATEIDLRRQRQIQNQRDSITRLLEERGDLEAASHTAEITRLCELLALRERKYALLVEWLRATSRLEASGLKSGEIDKIIMQIESAAEVELPTKQD